MRTGEQYGVTPVMPDVNYAAAKDHVRRVIETIEPVDSQERFEGFGVHVIREFGRFIRPSEVQAGETIITARRIVIATGSRPFVPPIPGMEDVPYYTNENIFDLREKPDHLMIIGGGPIGMEMAQAHVRLGCKVTVIEGAKALGKDDPEAARSCWRVCAPKGLKSSKRPRPRIAARLAAISVKTPRRRVSRVSSACGGRAQSEHRQAGS